MGIIERLTEPYWRFKWWWWAVIEAPLLPTVYNTIHRHKISKADHAIMTKRWEAKEPKRGVPKSVQEHRQMMTWYYGPDQSTWKRIPTEEMIAKKRSEQ